MAHIISKSDGPRREDAAAKQFIEKNRSTIDGIARHLTGGKWQGLDKAFAPPAPGAAKAPRSAIRPSSGEPQPYISISLNGRVVAIDANAGRQMHFLGDIRGVAATRRFYLATKANGFFEGLEAPLALILADFDASPLPDAAAEAALERALALRLGYPPSG